MAKAKTKEKEKEKVGLSWEFKPEKRTVKISGYYDKPATFEWLEPEYGELQAFKYLLERAAKAYVILGRSLHKMGNAEAKTYKDALPEVNHLLDETAKAGQAITDTCATVNKWFPQVLAPIFDGKTDEFLKFCREWIKAQAHPEDLAKNSSRGPSESTTDAPPETATIASGSSSTPKETPSGPASTKTSESPEKKTA